MTSGITLTSNPTTLSGTYSYVYGPSSGTYSVTNLGSIAATGTTFPGAVYLKLGGNLTNGSTAVTTASITGFGTDTGVLIVGGPGTVANFGTISGGGRGIALYDGGSVINGSTADTLAAITGNGLLTAVYVTGTAGGTAPTVFNYGTIGGGGSKNGVSFGTSAATGTLVNGSTADTAALIISGFETTGSGVSVDGPNGATIQNFGTIGGPAGRTGIYTGSDASAISITNGSTSDTTALITAGSTSGTGVLAKGATSLFNLVNFGTVAATAGSGVYLLSGGTVVNGSTADTVAAILDEGPHVGIYDKQGLSTVVNYGTIGDSNGHSGISFGTNDATGTVINGSTADTSALIISGSGTSGTGIYFGNSNGGSVLNFATIGGPAGRSGIYMAATAGAVTITNGSVLDTKAVIQGSGTHSGIYTKGSVSDIVNFGTIANLSGANGVAFANVGGGGTVVNGSTADTTALITSGTTAGSGVQDGNTSKPLTVENYGTITGIAGTAINFAGGTITNGSPTDTVATVRGPSAGGRGIGVSGTLPGAITNYGTVIGAEGIFFNTASAGGTVVNAGTIASSLGTVGNAILFMAPNDRVVDDPGAVFDGVVAADTAGANVLELAAGAGPGTLSGLGTSFANFTETTVDPGANWQLASFNTLNAGASLTVAGALAVTGNLGGSGLVALAGGTAALGNNLGAQLGITMAGAAADTLVLSGFFGGTLSNTITGFGLGDRIEVSGVSFDNATLSGAQLYLTSGGTTAFTLGNISIEGSLPPVFNFGTDGTTGDSYVEIACLAAGTRILTAADEVAVEEMRAGMLVPSLTQERLLRVNWVGHRTVVCARHPRPQDVWPVRIAAHAFAPGCPHRDLLLSPDHAVALHAERGGTVLIPARHLCNGTTIRQEAVDDVTYYHVELSAHDVVLTEGLPCESYLDTGNRAAFADGEGEVPDSANNLPGAAFHRR